MKAIRIIFVLFISAFTINSNPVIEPVISEYQVIAPQNWRMEINRRAFPSNSQKDTIKFISSRYTDTFSLILALPTADNRFIVINQDSIKPTWNAQVLEIHNGDNIKVIASQGMSSLVANVTGSDTSLCVCGYSSYYTKTDTPTFGTENKLPINIRKVYVLSLPDSQPVSGLHLYKAGGDIVCPTQDIGNVDTFFTVNINPCYSYDARIMDKPCGHNFGSVYFQYSSDASPRIDTIFIEPLTNAVRTPVSKNIPAELVIIPTPSRVNFVIKSSETVHNPADILITTISGKLVKKASLNIAHRGTYSISLSTDEIDGKHSSNGVYLVRLTINSRIVSKRFVLK